MPKESLTCSPNWQIQKASLAMNTFTLLKEEGTGFLAWRRKFVQKEASDGKKRKSQTPSPKGGPKADRDSVQGGNGSVTLLTESQCCEAIVLMKHTTDEGVIKEKMKQTFHYRQNMVRDPEKSSDIFSVSKISGHTRAGWNGDISSILVLLHLLPPPPHGCKRPGKLSARQAYDQLVKFLKTGTSIQDHLDSVRERRQPYLLACGNTKHMIHKYYIVTDKHVIPCKSSDSLAAFDEFFKAHFGFGTSYNQDLINVYNFLQTTIYDIDVGSTKVSPRVAELRARFL